MLTHFILHGANSVVILENVQSCWSSVSRATLVQEGLSILAVLAMLINNKRVSPFFLIIILID